MLRRKINERKVCIWKILFTSSTTNNLTQIFSWKASISFTIITYKNYSLESEKFSHQKIISTIRSLKKENRRINVYQLFTVLITRLTIEHNAKCSIHLCVYITEHTRNLTLSIVYSSAAMRSRFPAFRARGHETRHRANSTSLRKLCHSMMNLIDRFCLFIPSHFIDLFFSPEGSWKNVAVYVNFPLNEIFTRATVSYFPFSRAQVTQSIFRVSTSSTYWWTMRYLAKDERGKKNFLSSLGMSWM